ncbi:hypothetical protein GGR58DRAFT_514372 [Xylaria digitata]|nr:hypothetical protein GGR58DRAFT_514372 [Xylaria digitata]
MFFSITLLQSLYQLLNIKSFFLIDKATSAIIYKKFINRLLIAFFTLAGSLAAKCALGAHVYFAFFVNNVNKCFLVNGQNPFSNNKNKLNTILQAESNLFYSSSATLDDKIKSLLQLSRNNTPAAANRFINAGHRLPDNSKLRDSPAPLAKPNHKVKISGDLIFTIGAVFIGRKGNKDEALSKDSESGVEYNIVPILAAFPE